MHITKRVKVVAGVSALLGVVLAGGSAFTATGISLSASAADPQFIGGTVSQDVNGTTLESVVYTFTDSADGTSGTGNPGDETPGTGTNTEINEVTLTFNNDAAGTNVPTIDFTGTDTSTGDPTDTDATNNPGEYTEWTCTTIDSTTFVSTCQPTALSDFAGSDAPYAILVTSIAVTVPSTNNAG